MSSAAEGFLEKKSGGKSASPSRFKKAFLEKWDKRFFVLSAGGTELRYYHTAEEAHYQAHKPLGAVECAGAKVFLKAEQGELYRFTVLSAERELKLRAPDAASYRMWMEALEPIVGEFDESTRGSLQRLSSAGSVATEPSSSADAGDAEPPSPVATSARHRRPPRHSDAKSPSP